MNKRNMTVDMWIYESFGGFNIEIKISPGGCYLKEKLQYVDNWNWKHKKSLKALVSFENFRL